MKVKGATGQQMDEQWCAQKINSRGGSIIFPKNDGPIRIGHIGGVNRARILLYNLILILRFLIRRASHQKHSL